MTGFEHQVRHLPGDVVSTGIWPAQLDVGRVAQQQAGDVENGFFIGEDAGRNIPVVEGL